MSKDSPMFVHTTCGYINVNAIRQFELKDNSLEITIEEGKGSLCSVFVHDRAKEVFDRLKSLSINTTVPS